MSEIDHGDHTHPGMDTEELSYHARRVRAMETLLAEKGVLTVEEVQRNVDAVESRSPSDGARVVAKAWADPDYRARLLSDPEAALADMGYTLPDPTPKLGVVENSADVHHLVVCTLCSCYPRALLGRPPDWYKSFAYRSRAVVDPRGVLREFGTEVSDDTEVVVAGQHRRPALLGTAPASRRQRGHERGGAGRTGHPGLDDRRVPRLGGRAGRGRRLGRVLAPGSGPPAILPRSIIVDSRFRGRSLSGLSLLGIEGGTEPAYTGLVHQAVQERLHPGDAGVVAEAPA